jgi:hypothetical protein
LGTVEEELLAITLEEAKAKVRESVKLTDLESESLSLVICVIKHQHFLALLQHLAS